MIFASGNPFITSYLQSDWFGKLIFLALFSLSMISWSLLLYKTWLYARVSKISKEFKTQFSAEKLLHLQFTPPKEKLFEVPHPLFEIYKTLKQKTFQMISRNHLFAPNSETSFSEADLNLIESGIQSVISSQQKLLEKNLFILSTIVTLGPFLGLLGTVWGILLAFSQLHLRGISVNNAAMLSGLSMALTTTVIGLVIAIPALIGYNYLKNKAREIGHEMQSFSELLLSHVELQYRKPDHAQKTLYP